MDKRVEKNWGEYFIVYSIFYKKMNNILIIRC